MNEEFPWTWLAMVAIAFISWVFNRIQEATAERQRARELARRREKAAAEGRPGSGGAAEAPVEPPPLPGRREPRPVLDDAEASLRELMEALGGPPAKPGPPAPEVGRRPAAPPPRGARRERPLPAAASQPKPPASEPELSEAERAALERLRRQPTPSPATPAAVASTRRQAPPVTEWLRRPGGLKQAIVLREILDQPLSLR